MIDAEEYEFIGLVEKDENIDGFLLELSHPAQEDLENQGFESKPGKVAIGGSG